ncbi:MAG: hypothetical protein AB7O62_15660 [Pirellulales bacterium]
MLSVSLLAQASSRIRFEWARLESFSQGWQYAALYAVCAAIVAYVIYMYRRDSVEISPWVGGLLTLLRIGAFVGLLLVYLQPQYRAERDVVRNSRVVLLADTSLSMGRTDSESPSVQAGQTRAQQVIAALAEGDLLKQLRQTHDVVVMRFDQDVSRVASFNKLASSEAAVPATSDSAAVAEEPKVSWDEALAPRGPETRLGQALRRVVADERSGPVSGVVVFTEGAQNSGIEPSLAIESARNAKLPIFAVGIGSDKQPVNVQVADMLAPARAYPGDAYTVTGYIQSQGLAGSTVSVELASRPAEDGAAANTPWQIEGTQEITLPADGKSVTVTFDQTPSEVGRKTLTLRVQPPPADRNPRDNAREVDIEIVDRKTRVLLFAGGPTREYTFLRNQLHRDKETVTDILLQTAQEGISQDANEILDDFPATRDELYEYDCIVAFDPNWEELDANQVSLLEKWVGEQAGGLVLIAGPVYMDSWVQRPNLSSIRALYPVEFHKRFALLEDGRFGSTEPWPIDFTREGTEADFLWLGDNASTSLQSWSEFPGVYGYYAVKAPKPGATVFGYYSDPRAVDGEHRPVYMAGQFYGSGRVFYMGSGEIWRLRSQDETYFEQFYTKLIRNVTQGRLLRGSSRGVLLLDRDRYLLGNTVAVRAQLSNSQLEPLDVPSVSLQVYLPDGAIEPVLMQKIPNSIGNYAGQFSVYQEGSYRLELPVPESKDERLVRRIQVKLPDLESENPRRNDALLSEIAEKTGGTYYIGLEAAMGAGTQMSLAKSLPDKQRISRLLEAPDQDWDKRWMTWMLGVICGLLCFEWLIRRLAKLA